MTVGGSRSGSAWRGIWRLGVVFSGILEKLPLEALDDGAAKLRWIDGCILRFASQEMDMFMRPIALPVQGDGYTSGVGQPPGWFLH